jgi:RHS repeat-associated protein
VERKTQGVRGLICSNGRRLLRCTRPLVVLNFLLALLFFLCFSPSARATSPSITSLSPNSGAVGASVTIAGSNFGSTQGTSTVKFNGTAATATSWSATSIVTTVPTGATTGNVVVTVSGHASNGVSFTVLQAPSIASVNPTWGVVGASVTIAGSNFGTTKGTSTVTFNGTTATPTGWSTTSITAPVPNGATTGNVVVTVSGVASNGVRFAVPTSPISFVQGSCFDGFNCSDGQAVSNTSVIVPYKAAQSGGNLNVVVVGWYDITAQVQSVTDSRGNAYALAVGPTQRSSLAGTLAIYYAKNIASASPYNVVSVAFTSAPNNPEVLIAEYSGLDKLNPLDVAVANQGNSTNSSVGPATTTNANDLLVASNLASLGLVAVGGGTTVGPGYNTRILTTANILEDNVVTSTGSYSATAPMTMQVDFIMQMVAFRLAAAGSGTPPSITSLSPTSGAVGTSVTITGANFGASQGTSTVTFNGTSATPTTWSATSIVVAVPSGATTGNVVVKVGGQASSSVVFTVPVSPNITNVNPTSGSAGTSVTITGTNFGAAQGTSIVTFNGIVAHPTSWGATSITTPVPAGATTGNVVVTVSAVASNGVLFTSSSLSTPINFVQGNCFDGAYFSSCSSGGQVVSNTSVIVPYKAAQSGGNLNVVVVGWYDVTAQVQSVTDSRGNAYALAAGPTQRSGLGTLAIYYAKNIASASPYNVVSVVMSAPSSPQVLIAEYSGLDKVNPLDVAATNQGSSDTSSCGPVTTTNANDLLVASNLASSTLMAIGGGSSVGPGYTARMIPINNIMEDQVVTTTGSYSATAPMTIQVDFIMQMVAFRAAAAGSGAPASITSLSPTSGAVGTPVTITGTNFGTSQGTSTVTFNGTSATPTTWSATSIVVPVPSGATTGNVVVTVGGIASNGVSFTVTVPAPSITSLSPTSGGIGSSVTVTGANFGATQGTSAVKFNGTAGTPTSWSATSIVVPVPSGATSGNVVVIVSGVTSNGAAFTVLPTPNITSLSPTSGGIGSAVTITGTNFGATQGTSTVTFNGTVGTPTSWNATTIVVPVPSGATTGNVVVTVSGVASNGVTFTVTVAPAPTISSFSPTSASIGTVITVSGTNFTANGASPSVTLNQQGGGTIPASVSSASSTSLSFVIPTGAATGPVTVTANGQSAVSSGTLTVTAATSFTLTASPSTATLLPGQTTTYQISLASTNGFTQLASLAVSGVPTGVAANFQPAQITAGQFSILTLTAPANQSPSATQLTITATAVVQGITQNPSANVTLSVQGLSGVTFAGRVAVTDALETPLAGLTVRMMGVNQNGVSTGCTGSATSDGSGNFVLSGLSASCAGGQLIQYDPSTVTSPAGTFSGVTLSYSLTSGQVTTPGIIVHLPRVNNAETFSVQQNASVDQTFASATIPGVTITVYAHTTFTLADGTSQPNPFPLSVVEIPIDRLPDKMPPDPTQDPVFAMSIEPFNSSSSQPVAVSYPNRSKLPPGTAMPLTSLNPTLGMMVNYGTGSISADGTQVVPNFDSAHAGHRFGISHFDWHLPEPGPNPKNPCLDGGNCPKGADPVDLASGLFSFTKTDIVLEGARGQVAIARTFRGATTNAGPFGIGTNHNYGYILDASNADGGLINLVMPDGNQIPFVQSGTVFVNTTVPSARGAAINNVSCSVSTGCAATLTWKDNTTFQFQSFNYLLSSALFLGSITDANGNKTTLVHGGSAPLEITQIIDPVGRTLNLTYDISQRINSITDPIGRTVRYTYTPQGYLQTVTDMNNGVTTYGYDTSNNLTTITDARHITYLTNLYDQNGLVKTQTAADGGVTTFAYSLSNPTISTSPVLQTIVTDPLGNQTTYHFNASGFLLDVTDALGRKTVYTRDPGTNLLLSVTDPLNRTTAFTYDSAGDTTSVTRLAGTPNAVITSFTYDPVFNKLTSTTDPLNHTSSFSYDKAGNLIKVQDPLNPPSTLKYDGVGELISTTDPLSNPPTQIAYDGFGNAAQSLDPLGRKFNKVSDAVGRIQTSTNAMGQAVQYQYSPLNQVTQVTDPLNGQTSLTYDPNGNLLTLTDALGSGHVTTYTYDSMDRPATRKDPLGNSESYQYDLNGNLVQFTDRRGKVATYKYDALNRRIFAGFGSQPGPPFESTITYSYDAGGRLILAADSVTGTITRGYDGLDRLTSEVSPQGSVSYAYDAAGRRTSMTVSGQTAVTYGYDNANRLTQISQGSTNVSFGYDNDSRRTSLTLPNGVNLNYGYDPASQLTSISYTLGATTLGNLTYAYDLGGRRAGVGGTYARGNAPQAASTASYNVNNQLTQWKGASLTYDANGNLTSDGTNTYTWNARNQLVSISGGTTASFQYDTFGRRVSKSIGGTTQYLYDGVNPVQEISGTAASANLLTGRVDEYFGRTDSSGAHSFLTDALGNTLGLADSTGTLQTQYTFEPFGSTTVTGATTTNSFDFTGRELDATGLYYYRARYYNPSFGRFLSEDALRFAGSGPNFYAYASNDPINLTDPLGLYDGWDLLQDVGSFSEAFADTLTFGSASRLNDALGANVAVNRCGWVHKAGTVAGIAASIPLGGEAFPAALKWLPTGTKGAIGEGLSFVNNTLKGSRFVGAQVKAADLGLDLTTVFDSVWEAGGETYYVESKFGTSVIKAGSPQALAQDALGEAYHVERWPYPFFGQAGRYLGPVGGAAGAMAGRSCGCN